MPSRNLQHLTDSKARYLVASLKPEEWEWRELTGRDYGIDMEWDPFEKGNSLGRILLLQLKGRQTDIKDNVVVGFNVKTATLKYAARFISPIVLMVCPVMRAQAACRFVWLQEYIRVRLNFETSDWRRRNSVTVYLPTANRLPGVEAQRRLRHIADHPQRLMSFGKLSLIQNEVRREARTMRSAAVKDDTRVRRIRRHLIEARRLPGLSREKRNVLAQVSREEAINPGIAACDLLLAGPPYRPNAVQALNWQPTGQLCPANGLDALLVRLERAGDQMSSYLANV